LLRQTKLTAPLSPFNGGGSKTFAQGGGKTDTAIEEIIKHVKKVLLDESISVTVATTNEINCAIITFVDEENATRINFINNAIG